MKIQKLKMVKVNQNRICFFPGTMALGGIGRLTLNLMEELVYQGKDVDLFLTHRRGNYIEDVPEAVHIYYGKESLKSSLFVYGKYLKKRKPYAVISSRPYLNIGNIVVNKFCRSNSKTIITFHVNESASETENLKNKIANILGSYLYSLSDKIIAVSEGVKRDICSRLFIKEKDVEVVYNPVYSPKNYNSNQTPESDWIRDPNLQVILGAGRLRKQKGFDVLIEAFSLLKDNSKKRLIIIGEGEERDALEQKVKALSLRDKVSLPGFQQDPFSYYSNVDLYVMSSRWEGFGNTVVEALGAGTPVVSTDCPSGPAEILNSPDFGSLVPVDDPETLAQAIDKELIKEHDSEILTRRAQDFSVSKIANKYLDIIYES